MTGMFSGVMSGGLRLGFCLLQDEQQPIWVSLAATKDRAVPRHPKRVLWALGVSGQVWPSQSSPPPGANPPSFLSAGPPSFLPAQLFVSGLLRTTFWCP